MVVLTNYKIFIYTFIINLSNYFSNLSLYYSKYSFLITNYPKLYNTLIYKLLAFARSIFHLFFVYVQTKIQRLQSHKIKNFVYNSIIEIFVCEKNDRKITMLILDKSNTISEIIRIAVFDNHRYHGIGKYMIYQVVKSEHLKNIKVETDNDLVEFL